MKQYTAWARRWISIMYGRKKNKVIEAEERKKGKEKDWSWWVKNLREFMIRWESSIFWKILCNPCGSLEDSQGCHVEEMGKKWLAEYWIPTRNHLDRVWTSDQNARAAWNS